MTDEAQTAVGEAVERLTSSQVALLRDIEATCAIHALLFSVHRAAGPSLREAGLIDGHGQDVHLTKSARSALQSMKGE